MSDESFTDRPWDRPLPRCPLDPGWLCSAICRIVLPRDLCEATPAGLRRLRAMGMEAEDFLGCPAPPTGRG